MIYFIRTSLGMIKIGTTKNINLRMISLTRDIGKNLTLLATLPGGRSEEKKLHERFSHLRVASPELFRESPELNELIEEARNGGPQPNETPTYEGIEFQIPVELATEIRQRACDRRCSISRIGTELLILGLGLNLADYGY